MVVVQVNHAHAEPASLHSQTANQPRRLRRPTLSNVKPREKGFMEVKGKLMGTQP
jgi:hypothetical protein